MPIILGARTMWFAWPTEEEFISGDCIFAAIVGQTPPQMTQIFFEKKTCFFRTFGHKEKKDSSFLGDYGTGKVKQEDCGKG